NLVPARRGCYLHQSAEQTFSYDTPRHAQNERRGTERVVGTDRIRLVPNDFSPCKENDPDYDPDEIRDLPGFPGPTEIAVRKFGLVGYAAALTDFVVNKKDERVCPSLQRRWGLRVAFMPEDVDINGEQEYVIQSYLAWID
ncbi:MAG TPA: hypothetical protein VFF73_21700, partial [Planctomycetota bacterium]|nr:hypothetical protein [Planctomycetota bacterium]